MTTDHCSLIFVMILGCRVSLGGTEQRRGILEEGAGGRGRHYNPKKYLTFF